MKRIMLLLLVWQVNAIGAEQAQTEDREKANLFLALERVLPKGWMIENRVASFEIIGPEVRVLSTLSRPPEPEDVLWKKYSLPIKVQLTIDFQARLPDKALAELRIMRDRLRELTEMAADKHRKDWGYSIQEYGVIKLPDFQSATTSIFVKNNIGRQRVQPEETLAVFNLIDKELAARFAKVPEK